MATPSSSSLSAAAASLSSSSCRRSLHAPINRRRQSIALPKLPPKRDQDPACTTNLSHISLCYNKSMTMTMTTMTDESLLVAKLYAVADAAADRAQMHNIIGEQRNNWNHLLLHSINSMTLTASITAGISSIPALIQSSPHLHLAFKLSSVFLFAASTAVMTATNAIQPSQLAEEQRNATRLFRKLEKSIENTLALRSPPTELDVEEAMERVLAIDKAYPLPLLPGMLDKFPETVEPTVWWPKFKPSTINRPQNNNQCNNGWSRALENEMNCIVGRLKSKDREQYVKFGKLVLRVNKGFAVLGPMLAGLAAIGAGLVGVGGLGPWPVLAGALGGAMAAVVNALQHGGQIGMVFELARNCGGFYKELEEEIEGNLREGDAERRENGGLFEMKVGLRLGRSLCELKEFGREGGDIGEFAGKLL